METSICSALWRGLPLLGLSKEPGVGFAPCLSASITCPDPQGGTSATSLLQAQLFPALKRKAPSRKDDILTSSSSHLYRSQLVTTVALCLFHSSRNTVAVGGRWEHGDPQGWPCRSHPSIPQHRLDSCVTIQPDGKAAWTALGP